MWNTDDTDDTDGTDKIDEDPAEWFYSRAIKKENGYSGLDYTDCCKFVEAKSIKN